MTPEHNNWHSVPEIVKEETLNLVNGNKKLLRSLLTNGYYLEIKNGTTNLIEERKLCEEEKEKLKVRAIRSNIFHHIRGFNKSDCYEANQKALVIRYGDITLEDAEKRHGYSRYRCEIKGKHRSITKGKGFSAAYRRNQKKR